MLERLRAIVPGFIRNSYVAKFGIALAAVILLVGAVGGLVYAQTSDTLEQDTEQRLQTAATAESEQIGQWVRHMRIRQTTQVNSRAFQTNDTEEIDLRLVSTVENDRSVEDAYHVNVRSGAVIGKYGYGRLAADGRLSDSVRGRIANLSDSPATVTTSNVFRHEEGGPPLWLFVSTVPNDEDRALVTVINAEQLSETTIQSRGDGRAVVVDDRGRVVLSRNTSEILERSAITPASESAGFDTAVDRGGTEQAVGYAPVSSTDWTVTTRTPTAQAFALRTEISRGVLAMVALGAGGALLVGLTVGRNTIRAVRDLARRAGELEQGDLDTDLSTTRTDEFGDLYGAFGSMRDSLRDQIRAAEEAKEEADRRREASEERAAHLEATAEEYGSVMRACAEGNLSRRLPPDEESKPMATVAHEFNQMMNELEATVAEVKRFADDVSASSERVTASTDDVRRSSEQVTESIQSISEGADRQNDQFQSVSAEMDELAASVQQVAAAADDVAELAERTADTGGEGRATAETAIAEMDDVAAASREAVVAIEALQDEMEEIQEVVDLITEMADQTDMVALNASVEAARSASDREGFGVVANEVRALADDTKEAAAEIEERIASVREQTERTADEVRAARDDVTRSAESVRDVAAAFDDVAEYADETNTGVQEIRAATSQQATSTEEVVSMVSTAASISEETTAEAETVAAAAEEQTATLGEVANDVSGLASQAERLHDALDRFETDSETEGLRPSPAQ
ncbi:methyl-accepting chemotaxis protein [Halostella litorea]|uniref:methyl-accepting chemotaxis protein n=1 Tax=Halostella litorea TaxID=2528831 RepID=UPI00109326FC|nr:methyl-accepting chemotaxis protein [Halostella litorea]